MVVIMLLDVDVHSFVALYSMLPMYTVFQPVRALNNPPTPLVRLTAERLTRLDCLVQL